MARSVGLQGYDNDWIARPRRNRGKSICICLSTCVLQCVHVVFGDPLQDSHELCAQWAKAGECSKNAAYMWQQCQPSCAAQWQAAKTNVGVASSARDLTNSKTADELGSSREAKLGQETEQKEPRHANASQTTSGHRERDWPAQGTHANWETDNVTDFAKEATSATSGRRNEDLERDSINTGTVDERTKIPLVHHESDVESGRLGCWQACSQAGSQANKQACSQACSQALQAASYRGGNGSSNRDVTDKDSSVNGTKDDRVDLPAAVSHDAEKSRVDVPVHVTNGDEALARSVEEETDTRKSKMVNIKEEKYKTRDYTHTLDAQENTRAFFPQYPAQILLRLLEVLLTLRQSIIVDRGPGRMPGINLKFVIGLSIIGVSLYLLVLTMIVKKGRAKKRLSSESGTQRPRPLAKDNARSHDVSAASPRRPSQPEVFDIGDHQVDKSNSRLQEVEDSAASPSSTSTTDVTTCASCRKSADTAQAGLVRREVLLKNLKAERDALTSLRLELDNVRSELDEKELALEARDAEAAERIAEAEARADAAQAEADASRRVANAAEASRDRAISDLRADLQLVKLQLASEQRNVELVTEQRDAEARRRGEAEATAAKAAQELNSLKDEESGVRALQVVVDAERAEVDQKQKEVADEIKRAEAKMGAMRGQAASQASEYQRLAQENKRLTQELETLRDGETGLLRTKAELEERARQVQCSETDLQKRQNELETAMEQRQSIDEAKVKAVAEQAAQQSQEYLRLLEESKKFRQRVTDLEAERASTLALKKENEQRRLCLDEREYELGIGEREFKETSKKADAEMTALREQAARQAQEYLRLTDENQSLKSQLRALDLNSAAVRKSN